MVETRRLRDLLSFVVDNRGRTCPTAEDGIPLIATNCVKNSTLYPVFEKVRYVDEKTYANWFRAHPQPGDLIFVLKGTPGQVCITPDPVSFCIAQDMVALRANAEVVDPSYLFAALRSPGIQAEIANLHVGSMIAHFKKSDFDRLELPLPDRKTQGGIGGLYLRISEKIEHNTRTAATLEDMARALYRSWFVDFDPVWAKAEGRTPAHMDEATAALFPESFGDDGLPLGWREGRLNELVTLRNEKIKPSSETEALPYIPIDCIPAKSLLLSETRPGREAQSSLTKFYSKDILFGAMRPYFHKVVVAPFEGTTRTTVFPLYPHSENDFALSVMLLHDPTTIEYATAHSTGSTIPYAKWGDSMESMPVNIPPVELRMQFNEIACRVLGRLPHLFAENQTLAALRDTLLPKLMSGELRVGEAQELAEAVA